MLTLKTSSFIIASMFWLAARALVRISRPAGLQVDRLGTARPKVKKVGATTTARPDLSPEALLARIMQRFDLCAVQGAVFG